MITGIYGNGCSFMYGYFLDNPTIAKHYDFVNSKSKEELGNNITIDNHPSYNGHKLIANKIYQYLLV